MADCISSLYLLMLPLQTAMGFLAYLVALLVSLCVLACEVSTKVGVGGERRS